MRKVLKVVKTVLQSFILIGVFRRRVLKLGFCHPAEQRLKSSVNIPGCKRSRRFARHLNIRTVVTQEDELQTDCAIAKKFLVLGQLWDSLHFKPELVWLLKGIMQHNSPQGMDPQDLVNFLDPRDLI